MVHVISRHIWRARKPKPGKVQYTVPLSERKYLFAHYLGEEDAKPDRLGQLQWVQRYHQDYNNWSDIGYNFVIDQDGRIYEGRGRDVVGAHCPKFNRNGIGVLFMMGDDDELSDDAKLAFRALHHELETQKGGKLILKGHRDGKSTACPGENVYAWVTAGAPAPNSAIVPPVVRPKPKEPLNTMVIMKGKAVQAYLTDGLTTKRWIKSGETVQAMRLDGFRYVEGDEYESVLQPLNEGPPIT